MAGIKAMAVIVSVILTGCAASRQGGVESAPGGLSRSEQVRRFRALEEAAAELDAAQVSELPDVSEEDRFFLLESVVSAPAMDQQRESYVVLPPQEWTIGTTEEGEEIRVAFLQPEGGAMTLDHDGVLEAPDEVSVTWVVRYDRKNVLLTESGTAVSVHVTPVAARVDIPDRNPLFWISSEAPAP